uniref:adenylate cyclase n=1 Tax=Timema tahoe TaxID=61484 RepID=A0A7R9ICC7_9NEOP|nr:unnamed protein product [Timema tahoe]
MEMSGALKVGMEVSGTLKVGVEVSGAQKVGMEVSGTLKVGVEVSGAQKVGEEMLGRMVEDRKLNDRLNMRIGVHSGKVFSGLLGVCKWQYDVWSHDVIIANHMEQAGLPGQVHVTKKTLEFLGSEYRFRSGNGARRSSFLKKNNIETFFIVSKDGAVDNHSVRNLRNGVDISIGGASRRRMVFMDDNLQSYQQTLRMADEQMKDAISNMQVGVYDRWRFRETFINPLCLTFEDLRWELPFIKQPDPLFKFYVGCALAIVLGMMAIQGISMPSTTRHMFTPDRYSDHWMPWAGFGVAICLLLSLLPLTWSHYIWNKWQDPHQELEVINDPRNRLVMFLYKSSLKVVWSSPTRIFLYLIMCSTLTGCAMLELVIFLCYVLELLECDIDVEQGKKNLNKTMTTLSLSMEEEVLMSQCLPPWQVTETCSLVIIMSFLFLRIHFQLKLLVGCLIVGFFSWAVWFLNPELFSQGETWNPGMHPMVAHVLSIVFLTVTLHLLDRQTEYMNRLDYKWKRQLAVEQEEGTTTHMVNKMLLENILPVHVAKLYLNTNRSYGELYHEEYNTVAVMFATITGYALWDEDNPYGNNQRTSLIVLNHIICDFDKVGYLWDNIMCDFDKVGYLYDNIMCDFDKVGYLWDNIMCDFDKVGYLWDNIMCDFDKVGYLWDNIMCDFDKVGYLWDNIMCDFDKVGYLWDNIMCDFDKVGYLWDNIMCDFDKVGYLWDNIMCDFDKVGYLWDNIMCDFDKVGYLWDNIMCDFDKVGYLWDNIMCDFDKVGYLWDNIMCDFDKVGYLWDNIMCDFDKVGYLWDNIMCDFDKVGYLWDNIMCDFDKVGYLWDNIMCDFDKVGYLWDNIMCDFDKVGYLWDNIMCDFDKVGYLWDNIMCDFDKVGYLWDNIMCDFDKVGYLWDNIMCDFDKVGYLWDNIMCDFDKVGYLWDNIMCDFDKVGYLWDNIMCDFDKVGYLWDNIMCDFDKVGYLWDNIMCDFDKVGYLWDNIMCDFDKVGYLWDNIMCDFDKVGYLWDNIMCDFDKVGYLWDNIMCDFDKVGYLWDNIMCDFDKVGYLWDNIMCDFDKVGYLWDNIMCDFDKVGYLWDNIMCDFDKVGYLWDNIMCDFDKVGYLWDNIMCDFDKVGYLWDNIMCDFDKVGYLWDNIMCDFDKVGYLWDNIMCDFDKVGYLWDNIMCDFDKVGYLWDNIMCDSDKVGYLWDNIMCDFDKVGYLWDSIMCDFDKVAYLWDNIICDSDKLLFDPSCLRVEKIKMAGWTYMAACGLDPGRRDSNLSLSRQTYLEHVLVVLARFATKMMRVLVRHTVGQDFTLRVGISHGKVTAGVVGSRKPLYDIWGDAVNMASRMDSTGESGRIQVPAETARVLREEGVSCTQRGITFVKGKGDMMTYFVDTDEELRLVSDNHPNTGGPLETQSQNDPEEFITRL